MPICHLGKRTQTDLPQCERSEAIHSGRARTWTASAHCASHDNAEISDVIARLDQASSALELDHPL
jgi:hypothetical protein